MGKVDSNSYPKMHAKEISERPDVEGKRVVLGLPKAYVHRLVEIPSHPRFIGWTTIVFERDVEWELYGLVEVH